MSNWAAGNKALCVTPFLGRFAYDGTPAPGPFPKVGTIYLVDEVLPCSDGKAGLRLAGIEYEHPLSSHCSSRFRKLVPLSERNAQQEEGLLPHRGFWESRPDL